MNKLLSKLNIGPRIILGFASVLVIATAITIPAIVVQVTQVIAKAEKHELQTLFDNVRGRIESEGHLAQALSSTLASMDYIKDMFINGQRDELYAAVAPAYKTLRANYNVRQFQFHTPPATSFLRVHKPEKFGDDLSSFRHTVVKVNTSLTGIWGLEKGVAGLGIRGVMPIIKNDEHYGSVEFGMSFGQPFFEAVKSGYTGRGMELALHVLKDGKYQAFAKTFEAEHLLSQAQLNDAMSGKFVLDQVNINGVPKSVYAARINDYAGEPVGILEIAINRDEYAQAENSVMTTILIVGVLALMFGMLIAVSISRSIAQPLRNAKNAMDDIAEGEGDLTQRLPVRGRDEIAQMADAFNRFAAKVQNTVSKVAASTTQIATASEEMSAVTAQSDQLMQKQKGETEMVVTAINEMAATIREVALNAESAAASAIEADQQSRNGRQVVMSTVEAINNLANEVKHAAEVIHKLEEDSQNIGTVLDVIKDVAEQTNLLALNAAIEAARAGEQGRGFAVVADEVRTLASRTQESTDEIQKIIEGFQRSAHEAVDVMQQGQSKAEDSVQQAAKAGDSLNAITSAVTTINDMNQQIASAAEQQSAVAEEINESIVSINTATDQASEGSRHTASSSAELAKLATELQHQVNQFKY
jgi:methyl-accepting chemotaxis protein